MMTVLYKYVTMDWLGALRVSQSLDTRGLHQSSLLPQLVAWIVQKGLEERVGEVIAIMEDQFKYLHFRSFKFLHPLKRK